MFGWTVLQAERGSRSTAPCILQKPDEIPARNSLDILTTVAARGQQAGS
jgi:hypothetical protein